MTDIRNQVLTNHTKALPDKVLGFFFDYRALSNFHIEPFTWSDVIWNCSENAYQAAKTDRSDWPRFAAMTPSEARKEGQKVHLRKDWEQVKISVMTEICQAKFTQCPIAKKCLLNSKQAHLEESTWWKDQFWGTYKGNGRNELGKILMTIRSQLQGEVDV